MLNNTPIVQLFYKKSFESNVAELIEIPYCGQWCSLERWYQLYGIFLPIDWDVECLIVPGNYYSLKIGK